MRALEPSKKAVVEGPGRSKQGNRLFVGGIPFQTTRKELYDYFSLFGPLKSVNLSRSDADPTSNRGFGFVVFEEAPDAHSALAHPSNHTIRSKVVRSPVGRPPRRRLQRRSRSFRSQEYSQPRILPQPASGIPP